MDRNRNAHVAKPRIKWIPPNAERLIGVSSDDLTNAVIKLLEERDWGYGGLMSEYLGEWHGDTLKEYATKVAADPSNIQANTDFAQLMCIALLQTTDDGIWLWFVQTLVVLLDLELIANRCIEAESPSRDSRLAIDGAKAFAKFERSPDSEEPEPAAAACA